jgi:hypothetical protein
MNAFMSRRPSEVVTKSSCRLATERYRPVCKCRPLLLRKRMAPRRQEYRQPAAIGLAGGGAWAAADAGDRVPQQRIARYVETTPLSAQSDVFLMVLMAFAGPRHRGCCSVLMTLSLPYRRGTPSDRGPRLGRGGRCCCAWVRRAHGRARRMLTCGGARRSRRRACAGIP